MDQHLTQITLRSQLEALVKNAREITCNNEIKKLREEIYKGVFKAFSLRLRPSVGGFSLVSYASYYPQRGRPNLKTPHDLENELKGLQNGTLKLQSPGRSTPEKSLQSWLISVARMNSGEIPPLAAAMKDSNKYFFVSDEIRITPPQWGPDYC